MRHNYVVVISETIILTTFIYSSIIGNACLFVEIKNIDGFNLRYAP